jgi:1,2-diacylglycerol 3-beta-galactosyltransferase
MSTPRRLRTILFLIADTGAGHRSAANAILTAMRQLAMDEPSGKQPRAHGAHHPGWRAVIVDAFADCCRFPLRQGVLLYGPAVQHSPRLYGEIYRFTNSRTRFDTARRLCQPFLRQGLRQLIERTRPDVIVSIHPLLNHITIQTLRDLRLHIPLITVVTDLVTLHCAWTAPGVDACVVPTEAARELALAAGIPRERIHLLGMPIHPAFARADERSLEEKRAALGLDPALPVILMMGGGEGAGGLAAAVEAVSSEELPAQLVVIAGHNQRLRAELERLCTRFRTRVYVFGFVDNIPDFMHAADVIVTKAGPSTICEAIACKLPILLTGAVPGQEEGNVDFVRDNDIGELIEMPRKLAGALRHLLDPANPRLAALRQTMRRMRQPQASFDIARLILAHLPEPATSSIWEPRRARTHAPAHRSVSWVPLPRLASIPIRHVDGMRRALPSPARRRAGNAEHWVPGLVNLARMRALLKRERHETVQLWRSGGSRGRDDARAPLGGGRGSAHLR